MAALRNSQALPSKEDPNYDSSKTYEDLEKVISAGGNQWLTNVAGRPCLHAWCPETVESGVKTVLTRNPYYWKVDTEGNQLPYIDSIDVVLIQDCSSAPAGSFPGQVRSHLPRHG